jgi:hypothetical protein
MVIRARLAVILIALSCFGCKGPQQASSAGTGDGVASAASSPSPGGTQVEYIKDPTLNNMNAIPVTIPTNWKFQGVLFQPGNCIQGPSSVWRATSPDGKTFAEQMPVLAWVWGTGPMIGFTPKDGCLPLNGPMSAQDFVKYLSAILQVQYVSDVPVPAAQNAALQKDAQARKQKADEARATVKFMDGSVAMQGLLQVVLRCTQSLTAGPKGLAGGPGQPVHVVTTGSASTVNDCQANIAYMAGPVSQYAAMIQQWSAPKMGAGQGTDAWQDAWTKRQIATTQQQTKKFIDASNARFNAQQQEYKREAAVQQQMHEQFLSAMQAGTDASMARAAQVANTDHTIASDWVDYSLDRQTVLNTNNGQDSKIPNQAKPGGALQKVHGNGTPQ